MGVGALVVGSLYIKGRALSNLVFSPGQISAIHFDGVTPIIEFSVLVQNTNSASIPLNSIAGNVFAKDGNETTQLGNIYNFQPTVIQGNAATYLTLYCRCQVIPLVQQVISAFQYKNNQQQLIIQATANINGVQFAVPEFVLAVGV